MPKFACDAVTQKKESENKYKGPKLLDGDDLDRMTPATETK